MRWLWVAVLGLGCGNENTFSARTGSDTWLQAANDRVDILFVVDESSSMQEEQAILAQGFVSFAGQLEASGTDFHLGVLSTTFEYDDPQRGRLEGTPPYLTRDTEGYVAAFAQRAQVGTDGSDKEKGLEAAAYALSPVANLGLNEGFVRPEARLLVVYVSDEEDCSDAGALIGTDQDRCYTRDDLLVPIATYIDDLRAMKQEASDVQAAAIIGLDASCPSAYPSDRYRQVVELLGGSLGDICDGDWSTLLADLGLTATGVLTSFQLGDAAVVDSLEVYVDDVLAPPGDWSYDPATWYLSFAPDAIPPRGSVIVANYTIQPGQPTPPGAGLRSAGSAAGAAPAATGRPVR